jgi:serine/threonine protein kinase
MELADSNLEKYLIINNDIDAKARLDIFDKICEGLEYAHSKGVVHRDLWRNVLIKTQDSKLEIKINDFGRAKDFSLEKILYGNIPCWGNEYICPPEFYFNIWKDEKIENYIPGDFYALGILLFYIFISEPTYYYIEVGGSISGFQRRNGIADLASPDQPTRKNLYENWLKENNSQSFTSLHASLSDPNLTVEINKIISKLSHIDYRKRYENIRILRSDIKKLIC